ncbi:MAG TPA: carboxypeptidase-like regulatory domain-containing protein [Pyrinomonadaceae bacterium]|nr:carboxypeptidase-like regulatory domain-containing protein [Pyrinomonadaceae bacterium]
MKQHIKLLLTLFIAALSFGVADAQVAGNPPYTIEQSVIASGGGASAEAGNIYKLEGSIGQPIAASSSAAPLAVNSGFWTAGNLAPTTAPVTVSGRVLTLDGAGLRNARVTITAMDGEARTVLTGKSGAYRFANIEAGETYIISVASRRYVFQPQIVFVNEDLNELNFSAVSQTGSNILQP